MYFLKFLSNFIEKSWNEALKMLSNSLPDAGVNLPEMKTKSPSCPSGGVHMYEETCFRLHLNKRKTCLLLCFENDMQFQVFEVLTFYLIMYFHFLVDTLKTESRYFNPIEEE